ncbi:MAG TPA: hypothetical protein VK129_12790 [Terriglobales bacterium]|nr:hypothetical protein [Terriglobales bacterium]
MNEKEVRAAVTPIVRLNLDEGKIWFLSIWMNGETAQAAADRNLVTPNSRMVTHLTNPAVGLLTKERRISMITKNGPNSEPGAKIQTRIIR